MVGDGEQIRVRDLEWDETNEDHLALHAVTRRNVEAVALNTPLFFRNLPGRAATHVMIGRDDLGRVLYVPLLETQIPGVWRPISAWESRLARHLYEANQERTP